MSTRDYVGGCYGQVCEVGGLQIVPRELDFIIAIEEYLAESDNMFFILSEFNRIQTNQIEAKSYSFV